MIRVQRDEGPTLALIFYVSVFMIINLMYICSQLKPLQSVIKQRYKLWQHSNQIISEFKTVVQYFMFVKPMKEMICQNGSQNTQTRLRGWVGGSFLLLVGY